MTKLKYNTDLRQGSSIWGLSSKSTLNLSGYNFLKKSLDPDDPDSDPNHSQNLSTCSMSNLGHFLKISSKSNHNFLSYLSLKLTFHGSRRSR